MLRESRTCINVRELWAEHRSRKSGPNGKVIAGIIAAVAVLIVAGVTAVVFDVSVGTDPASITLHDGPFSEGVVVGF